MKNINDKDINELKRAVQSGNVDDFINKNLTAEQSARVKKALTDKKAVEKLLQTPQAKELMERLKNSK